MEGYIDWELCNDDGFVYKRDKRTSLSDPGETSNPELDPAVDERNRRMRKKRTLVKLKSKYQSEIEQWEVLSSSFNAMQEKASLFQTTQEQEESLNADEATSFRENGSASIFLDELLSMAEGQEEMINDVSNLCEVAENICKVEEEETKQTLFDLDVWSSPTNLMVSLCAD